MLRILRIIDSDSPRSRPRLSVYVLVEWMPEVLFLKNSFFKIFLIMIHFPRHRHAIGRQLSADPL